VKRYLFPTLGDILFISIFTVIILLGPRTFNLDGDLGRHITIGNYILDNFTIPQTDLFSHTMLHQSLTPHEWLAQAAFALAYRVLSLPGDVLMTAIVIALAFLLVFHESVKRSSMTLASLCITLLAAASASLHWLARPHIFTFLFLAIYLIMLEEVRTGRKIPVWMFGLVMLLWANTHGAFIAGFVCWGAYLSGEVLENLEQGEWDMVRIKTWGEIGILSFVVTFLNPTGISLWKTSFGFIGNRYLVSHTQEYLPPDFHNPGAWPFLFMIGLTIFVLSLKKNRPPLPHGLLLAGWGVMGLYSARNIPLFAIVAAPILSKMVADILSGVKRWDKFEGNILKIEQSLKGGFWGGASIMLVAIALSTPLMQAYNSFDKTIFPVEAVDWLEDNPQEGNVFNHFPWGGYLLYRQWPKTLVFIDGQTDFYGEQLTREYEQVITLEDGWKTVLVSYDVHWTLIPTRSKLAEMLKLDGWLVLYEDDIATILKRNE
jgi:hypothetical protein